LFFRDQSIMTSSTQQPVSMLLVNPDGETMIGIPQVVLPPVASAAMPEPSGHGRTVEGELAYQRDLEELHRQDDAYLAAREAGERATQNDFLRMMGQDQADFCSHDTYDTYKARGRERGSAPTSSICIAGLLYYRTLISFCFAFLSFSLPVQTASPAHHNDATVAAAIARDDAAVCRSIAIAAGGPDAVLPAPAPAPAPAADDWLRRMAEQDAAMRRAIERNDAGFR
jgi:hypothetical protein